MVYLRGKKFYDKKSPDFNQLYSYEDVGRKKLLTVIDKLVDAGYINNYIGNNSEMHGKMYSSIAPTKKLIDLFRKIPFLTMKDNLIDKPTHTVHLRESSTKEFYKSRDGNWKYRRVRGKALPVDYEAKHVKTLERLLKRYNDEIDNHQFEIIGMPHQL